MKHGKYGYVYVYVCLDLCGYREWSVWVWICVSVCVGPFVCEWVCGYVQVGWCVLVCMFVGVRGFLCGVYGCGYVWV